MELVRGLEDGKECTGTLLGKTYLRKVGKKGIMGKWEVR